MKYFLTRIDTYVKYELNIFHMIVKCLLKLYYVMSIYYVIKGTLQMLFNIIKRMIFDK